MPEVGELWQLRRYFPVSKAAGEFMLRRNNLALNCQKSAFPECVIFATEPWISEKKSKGAWQKPSSALNCAVQKRPLGS
jgi:hypothetical protein